MGTARKTGMKSGRSITKINRIVLLGSCAVLTWVWAAAIRSGGGGAVPDGDFASVYYQTRCALDHRDPYDPQMVLPEFEKDGQKFPGGPDSKTGMPVRHVITWGVYLPTTYSAMAPLAMLRWPVALTIWLSLIAVLFVLAGLLVWDLGDRAPALAGFFACFTVLNCTLLLHTGNPAGVAVPLCVIAVWCFIRERFAWAGVVILAIATVVKPHDCGFIWLYFLLAKGAGRKRALQTLAFMAIIGVGTAIWIGSFAPHWSSELRTHLNIDQRRGGDHDAGPHGMASRGVVNGIWLQTSLSVFRDDPRFYNPVSYALIGGLLLVWGIAVRRKRPTQERTLLALAAVSALTLLPIYHLAHDAKILLLMVPACAILWSGGGIRRWIAVGVTAAAFVATSDFFNVLVSIRYGNRDFPVTTLGEKLALLALQPAPIILLAAGCFYLWIYLRFEPEAQHEPAEDRAITSAGKVMA